MRNKYLSNTYILILYCCQLAVAQFNTVTTKPIPDYIKKKAIQKPKKTLYNYVSVSTHLPLENIFITSRYGYRNHPITGKNRFHYGIDLRGKGKNVYSVFSGKVTEVNYGSGSGIHIEITTEYNTEIKIGFSHLSKIFVADGQNLKPGTIIGITGTTGKSTGEHLHFSVKMDGEYLNPEHLLAIIFGKGNL